MPQFVLGMNGKMYEGPADTALGSLTEADNVLDVTVSLNAGEADVTTRGNSGWRAIAATLRECTVEFEMLWKTDDAVFAAIKNAFLASTTVALAPLTGERATSGTEGIVGNFSITNFSNTQPLEEGQKVSVSAKLAEFTQWVDIA